MSAALLPHVRALIDRRADRSDADLLRAFVHSRDEEAFAALVRRHGPLVLATARRGTGNPADADDVFQATFLLLARNAAAVRNPAAVAGWLHGVASRMARTARRAAARRQKHESRTPEPRPNGHCDLSWREVQQLFEEELARLPERYRLPFVLCVLNEEPRADVAKRLGIREGTISSRLAEAKRRLQDRLSARGVSLAVILGAASLPAAISAGLVERSVRTAIGSQVPAAVSALVRSGVGVLPAAAVSVVLVAVIGLAIAAGQSGGPPAKAPTAPKAAPAPAAELPKEKFAVRGTVLTADGKPSAGATVHLWSFRNGDTLPESKATTDADGRFQFDASPADLENDAKVVVKPKSPCRLVQWMPLSRFTSEQTLRLPKDDVKFTGKIVTLENQPLKCVTVQVVRVSNVAGGDLKGWIEKNVALRKKSIWLNENELVPVPGEVGLNEAFATTDSDGTFELDGFGQDRVLTVRVTRKGLETKHFWVVARPGGHAIEVPDVNFGVYGPDMTIRLGPSRPLVGTVRDAKTGQPVAGAIVSDANHHVPRAVTDKDGHYRLEGVPKKPMYHLNVCGTRGVPLFDRTAHGIKDVAGLDPLETDLTVNRGVEITGRIVDETGKPVRGEVGYDVSESNPNKPQIEPTVLSSDGWRTKPDGTFYVTAWPGKGVLWVFAKDAEKYATVDAEVALSELDVRSRPVGGVHAIIPLDVDESKPESQTITIRLDLAKKRQGKVLGPDGQPLAGVTVAGLKVNGEPQVLPAADFTMPAPQPGTTRLLVLMHEAKKLGAVVPVAGDSTDPVEVKLAPLGSATGRVMKSATEAGAKLAVTAIPDVPNARSFENLPTVTRKFQGTFGMLRGPWDPWTTRTAKTDADGKFTLDGLLPGLTYTVHVSDGDVGEAGTLVVSKRGVTVEAGRATELGELKR